MNENPKEQVVSFEQKEDDMKKVKATENLAKDTETKPIDRVDIQKKIDAQEKDVAELRKKGRELQGQVGQIEQIIVAKMGAIAAMKDLLGNA